MYFDVTDIMYSPHSLFEEDAWNSVSSNGLFTLHGIGNGTGTENRTGINGS